MILCHEYHTHIKRRAYDCGYAAAHALDGRRSDEAPYILFNRFLFFSMNS